MMSSSSWFIIVETVASVILGWILVVRPLLLWEMYNHLLRRSTQRRIGRHAVCTGSTRNVEHNDAGDRTSEVVDCHRQDRDKEGLSTLYYDDFHPSNSESNHSSSESSSSSLFSAETDVAAAVSLSPCFLHYDSDNDSTSGSLGPYHPTMKELRRFKDYQHSQSSDQERETREGSPTIDLSHIFRDRRHSERRVSNRELCPKRISSLSQGLKHKLSSRRLSVGQLRSLDSVSSAVSSSNRLPSRISSRRHTSKPSSPKVRVQQKLDCLDMPLFLEIYQ